MYIIILELAVCTCYSIIIKIMVFQCFFCIFRPCGSCLPSVNFFDEQEISCEEVEKEFWRLTTSLTDNVSVLYGADIHALTNGSGFPTELNDDLTEDDEVSC